VVEGNTFVSCNMMWHNCLKLKKKTLENMWTRELWRNWALSDISAWSVQVTWAFKDT